MATNLVSSQRLHLLDLPLEIRLQIYSLLFRTAPIYCSKFEPGIKTPYIFEHRGRQHRCFLRTRSGILFRICKQIRAEATSIFEHESPLDLYSWPMYTDQVPELASKAKHIICSTTRIEACFGLRAKDAKFDCLQKVTIIDGSHFFFDLTDGEYFPLPHKPFYREKRYGLDDAVAIFMKRGVKNIVIRSGRLLYYKREIVLKSDNSGVEIAVRGIDVGWAYSERVQDHILYAFSLRSLPTRFDLSPCWECDTPGPYEVLVDYTANFLDRQADPLNRIFEEFNVPARISVKDREHTLLGRTFDGRVLAKLALMMREKARVCRLIRRFKPDIETAWRKVNVVSELVEELRKSFPWASGRSNSWLSALAEGLKWEHTFTDVEVILRDRIMCERHIKIMLDKWMGERKALDEVIEICDFLAVTSGDE